MVIPIILYSSGYRFSFQKFQFLRAGGIFIRSLPATGNRIYIDGKFAHDTTLLSRNLFLQGLTPRVYNIRIEKDNYFDWEKSLQVLPERVTEVHALLIPKNPDEGLVLLHGDYTSMRFANTQKNILILTDRKKREQFFSTDSKTLIPLPGKIATSSPVVPEHVKTAMLAVKADGYDYDSAEERVTWWRNNSIRVRWLKGPDFLPYYTEESEIEIYSAPSVIRQVVFYPGQDAVIAAYSNAIMVIELDGRGKRNMYPLYKGKEPYFEVDGTEKMAYLLDAGNLISIPFP